MPLVTPYVTHKFARLQFASSADTICNPVIVGKVLCPPGNIFKITPQTNNSTNTYSYVKPYFSEMCKGIYIWNGTRNCKAPHRHKTIKTQGLWIIFETILKIYIWLTTELIHGNHLCLESNTPWFPWTSIIALFDKDMMYLLLGFQFRNWNDIILQVQFIHFSPLFWVAFLILMQVEWNVITSIYICVCVCGQKLDVTALTNGLSAATMLTTSSSNLPISFVVDGFGYIYWSDDSIWNDQRTCFRGVRSRCDS